MSTFELEAKKNKAAQPNLSDEEHLLLFLVSCRYDTHTTNQRPVKEALCSLPSPLSHHFHSHNASLHTYSEVHNLSPLFPFVRTVVPSLKALLQLPRSDLENLVLHPAGALPEQWAALTLALPQFRTPQEKHIIPRAPTGSSIHTSQRGVLVTPSSANPTVPVVRGWQRSAASSSSLVVPTTTEQMIVHKETRSAPGEASTTGGFQERGSGSREILCRRCHPKAHSAALTEWAWDKEERERGRGVTRSFDNTKKSKLLLRGSATSACAVVRPPVSRADPASDELLRDVDKAKGAEPQPKPPVHSTPPTKVRPTTLSLSSAALHQPTQSKSPSLLSRSSSNEPATFEPPNTELEPGGRLTLEQRKTIDEVRRAKANESERVRKECEDWFSRPFDPLSMTYSQNLGFDPSEVTYFIEAHAKDVTVTIPRFDKANSAKAGCRGRTHSPLSTCEPILPCPRDTMTWTERHPPAIPYDPPTTSYIEQRIELPRFEAMMEGANVPLTGMTRSRLWKLLLTQTQHTLPLRQRKKCNSISSDKFIRLLIAPAANGDDGGGQAEHQCHPPGGTTAHEALITIFHTFASNGLLIHEELSSRGSIPVEQHRMLMRMFQLRPGVSTTPVSGGSSPSCISPTKNSNQQSVAPAHLSILTFEDFCKALGEDPFHTALDGSRVHWCVNFFDKWASTLLRSDYFSRLEDAVFNPAKKKKKKKGGKKSAAGRKSPTRSSSPTGRRFSSRRIVKWSDDA